MDTPGGGKRNSEIDDLLGSAQDHINQGNIHAGVIICGAGTKTYEDARFARMAACAMISANDPYVIRTLGIESSCVASILLTLDDEADGLLIRELATLILKVSE